MSLIGDFISNLTSFLLLETKIDDRKDSNIIKQHTDKLKTNGDIAFSTLIKAWLPLTNGNLTKKVMNKEDTKFQTQLIEISQKWIFPIKQIQCTEERCVLFLNRNISIKNILNHVFNSETDIGHIKRTNDWLNKEFCVSLVLHQDDENLTQMRCKLIQKTLVNMLRTVGFNVRQNDENVSNKAINIIVTHSRRRNEQRKESTILHNQKITKIVCGTVKSQENLTAEDYIK